MYSWLFSSFQDDIMKRDKCRPLLMVRCTRKNSGERRLAKRKQNERDKDKEKLKAQHLRHGHCDHYARAANVPAYSKTGLGGKGKRRREEADCLRASYQPRAQVVNPSRELNFSVVTVIRPTSLDL